MDIEFTWDAVKARRNVAKHGVSFEQAKQVFFDPHLIVAEDREDEYGELSFHAIGYGENTSVLLSVAFADRSTDEEEVIYLISARKAEDYEQKTYARQFTQGD